MKTHVVLCVVFATLCAATASAQPAPATQPKSSELSAVDKAAGWKLLFDGKSTAAWRAYRGQGFPAKGWAIEDGCLRTFAGDGGADIVTVDQYGDFELELEWCVAEKANSGILYRVSEKLEQSWQSGPEYQILDDAGNGTAPTDPHSAGALYDLYGPAPDKVVRPVGQFNQARIRLQNNVLQHWLNGVKIIECRIDGDEWKTKISASKFKAFEGFGVQPKGHIALQSHGGDVWYRNLRIRALDEPMPGEVKLFNGKDLTGLTACLPEGAKKEDVWSVTDGVLICKGQPNGYIRTEKTYANYVLKLEWRFSPVTKKPGNSGVLLRIVGEDKVWPRSVEAQLQSENAGDFWDIDEFPMKGDPQRTNGRNTKKTHFAERPVGEWNEYEIIVNHDKITLDVNGEALNEATDVLETPGYIGLQSEGAEIHFRNVRLAPLD